MKDQVVFRSNKAASVEDNGGGSRHSKGQRRGSATWFAVLVLSCISGFAMAAAAFWLGAPLSLTTMVYFVISFCFFAAGMVVVALSNGKGL